jgi:hypothetical protein
VTDALARFHEHVDVVGKHLVDSHPYVVGMQVGLRGIELADVHHDAVEARVYVFHAAREFPPLTRLLVGDRTNDDDPRHADRQGNRVERPLHEFLIQHTHQRSGQEADSDQQVAQVLHIPTLRSRR